MAIPLKNIIHDKIKDMGSTTDVDLYKTLSKGGVLVAEDRFNKLLLDLEILGLIRVAWITKDERRIEAVEQKEPEDISKEISEKDYEASFPGFEK
ncbi:MAG: hypothetical protein OXC46_00230 [Thaumarchaeota archaeon]|nr:hypothetical protein [Nitrososphaerota archaeon]